VKIGISILAAAAIMAFAAPAAFSANSQIPVDSTSGTGSTHVTGGPTQPLVGRGKLAPSKDATIANLQRKNKQLAKQIAAQKAKGRALAAQLRLLTSQNQALSNWIGELNRQLAQYLPPPVAPQADPDADCRDYSVCTPEQDCRIWGNGCADAQPAQAPVVEATQDTSTESTSTDDSSAASQDSGSSTDQLALQSADVTDSAMSDEYEDC